MLAILPLNEENRAHFNRVDARFLAGDRLRLHMARNGFATDYSPLPSAEWRTVKPFPADVDVLLKNPRVACYFALADGQLAGQCVARLGPHRLCELLDIRVDSRFRRQGVGTELLNAYVPWGESLGCVGFRAEVADWQSVAAQFLEGAGFTLGGVDRLLHNGQPDQLALLPAMRESVLLYYQFWK